MFWENSNTKTRKIIENILSEDLVKCHHCDIEINLEDKSVRKNNFWFHDTCFGKIPTPKPEQQSRIKIISKPVKHPVRTVQSNTTYLQMSFSGGLLASLVGTTYFLAGDMIASLVGIWGSVLYFATYKSQIISKKRSNAKLN